MVCLVLVSGTGGARSEQGGGAVTPEDLIVRKAHGAGRWFPGDRGPLLAALHGYLAAADVSPGTNRIVAALSPHAGYPYSGPVAGYTFKALKAQAAAGIAPELVVVLGFSHREGFPGIALLDGDVMRTPLGDARLDAAARASLAAASERIVIDGRPHVGEHSAENQVPFVQYSLPDAALVVALMGDHDEASVDALARALTALAGTRRLCVVASTDLLHDPDYDRVTTTDRQTLALIESLKDSELWSRWDYRHQLCCGVAPVVTAMRFARAQGALVGQVLRYRNSGDDHPEGRGQWVVGYGAVIFSVSD